MNRQLVLFASVLSLSACDVGTTRVDVCETNAEGVCVPGSDLAVARARWTANRPPSYEFTVAISCFCGSETRRPVVVAVNGTTITSRTYADDGTPVAAQWASLFTTIDGLFDMLTAARSQNAARADATFDATLGYPLTIALDYRTTVADDEAFYTVSAFRSR